MDPQQVAALQTELELLRQDNAALLEAVGSATSCLPQSLALAGSMLWSSSW